MVNDVLEKYKKDIAKIQQQKLTWQLISFFSFLAVAALIIYWDWIEKFRSNSLWVFIVIFIGMIIGVWWYWTLKIIRRIIYHQEIEFDLIFSIQKDLKDIRSSIKEMNETSKS